jgi:glycosyltransferase involved in cell wall biosynthesis
LRFRLVNEAGWDSHSTPLPTDASAPSVSVIVAVLNGARTLERCIESVASQTYPHRELIVMDAGSTDGTLEILRQQDQVIAYWESKPDRGIRHAGNKALKQAEGDFLCFLGADDYFVSSESLARLVDAASEGVELVSCRVALVDENGNPQRTIGESWDWEGMKQFQRVAHHGMIQHSSLFTRVGTFDEEFTVVGDYEWLLRLGPSVRAAFVDDILVCAESRGGSRVMLREAFSQTWRIQARHVEIGSVRATVNYLNAWARALARRVLRIV